MVRVLRLLLSFLIIAHVLSAAAEEPAGDNKPVWFTPEQIQADFDYLYDGLQSANFDLYAFTGQDEFETRFQSLRRSFNQPMTRFDAEMSFQQFVALADQSHTRIESDFSGFFAHIASGGLVFPLDIAVENGQMLVTGNASSVQDIQPGDRITAIGEEKVTDLLPRLTAHLSAESPEFALVLLETYMPLVVWLENGRSDVSSVTVEHADGTRGVYDLGADPGVDRAVDVDENQASVETNQPYSLQGRDAKMLTETVAYLRPGPFSNTDLGANPLDTKKYLTFIDSAFEEFVDNKAAHLILDLRNNPGGNNSFSDPVIAWFADRPFRFSSDFRVRVSPLTTAANQARLATLPESSSNVSRLYAELFASSEDGQIVQFSIPEVKPRPEPRFAGEVTVLVNRYSFSNAVTAAALIQDYGFGTIMGEPTVDMATTYGAMERFTLPITGIVVTYPKALIVRPNGMDHAHPLTPDIALPSRRVRGVIDVMLQTATEHIQSNAEQSAVPGKESGKDSRKNNRKDNRKDRLLPST